MKVDLYRTSRKTRSVLLSGAVAGAIVLNVLPARAQSNDMKIGFATINDPQHAIAKLLAETINKRTSGKINARVFPAGRVDARLKELGIELPPPGPPAGNYVLKWNLA